MSRVFQEREKDSLVSPRVQAESHYRFVTKLQITLEKKENAFRRDEVRLRNLAVISLCETLISHVNAAIGHLSDGISPLIEILRNTMIS